MTEPANGFDGSAAITRSLLGWGVVASSFYLAVGIIGGLTREGISFGEHATCRSGLKPVGSRRP